jgi:hypothetical protein
MVVQGWPLGSPYFMPFCGSNCLDFGELGMQDGSTFWGIAWQHLGRQAAIIYEFRTETVNADAGCARQELWPDFAQL